MIRPDIITRSALSQRMSLDLVRAGLSERLTMLHLWAERAVRSATDCSFDPSRNLETDVTKFT
jgi:hypothetical protein